MRKILIFLVCMFFLNLSASLTFADGGDTKIIYLKGQAKLQRAKDTNWIVAKEGIVIKSGDRIKTFKFSAVEIAIDKEAKNVIRIEEESEFLFEEIAVNKHKLSRGKVFALLEALEHGSSFEVRTPTAPDPLIALTRHEQKEWLGFREGLMEHLEWLKGKKRRDSRKIIDRIKKLQDRSDKRTEIQREDRLEQREQEKREEATDRKGDVY